MLLHNAQSSNRHCFLFFCFPVIPERKCILLMPGDNVEIEVELIYKVALNEGLRFAIREGGRTVGSGQITKILPDVEEEG